MRYSMVGWADRAKAVVLYAALIAGMAAAAHLGGRRVQGHLDTQCRHGIATACALDGRHR